MLRAAVTEIAAAHATATNHDVLTLEQKRTIEKAVRNTFFERLALTYQIKLTTRRI